MVIELFLRLKIFINYDLSIILAFFVKKAITLYNKHLNPVPYNFSCTTESDKMYCLLNGA